MFGKVEFSADGVDHAESMRRMVAGGWHHYSTYNSYWLAGLVVSIWFRDEGRTWVVVYQEIEACQAGGHGTWIAGDDRAQDAIHRTLEIGPVPEYLRISDPRAIGGAEVKQHFRGEH